MNLSQAHSVTKGNTGSVGSSAPALTTGLPDRMPQAQRSAIGFVLLAIDWLGEQGRGPRGQTDYALHPQHLIQTGTLTAMPQIPWWIVTSVTRFCGRVWGLRMAPPR